MKESDMFLPLKKYLNNLGYKAYAEVPYGYGSSTDIIAVKRDRHIAIEMKTSLSRDLIRQCWLQMLPYYCRVDAVYAAVASNPRQSGIDSCIEKGIGLICVENGKVRLEVLAKDLNVKEYKDFTGWEEGEIAGVQNNGTSSARDCLMRIKIYLEKNPNADWKEIYQNVQNHYASHASMKSSMRQYQDFFL